MRFGFHVPPDDPLAEAAARDADAVQVFLTPPQSWDKPPERPDTDALRSSDVAVYVHAPYIINVATPNNRIRHPSRQNLERTVRAAEAIGAAGVIVHGGHVGDVDDPEVGFTNWRKTLDRLDTTVPVLIENTAGGENAMAREVDRIARLWEVLDGVETPYGLCLDTCHLWSAGEDLAKGVDRLMDATGGIALVHLNDSKDPAGSGRDRHESLGAGRVDETALLDVVRAAACDVICETPGDPDAHRRDLAWLQARL